MADNFFEGVDMSREGQLHDEIEGLKKKVKSGNLDEARRIIDHERKIVIRSADSEEGPDGQALEVLTRVQGMGLINELNEIGEFTGPLAKKRKNR